MDHTCGSTQVDQPVQQLPALSAQPANPTCGGRDGQRDHDDERCKARCNEWTLRDVFQNSGQIEELVEPQIGREMEAAVEERKESQHATEADDLRLREQLTNGRNRES